MGADDDHLYAVSPSGSEEWSFAGGNQFLSSPAIGPDGTIYIGCQDRNVYAVNPDGSEKWAFATGAAVQSSPAISPDGSTIYVGSWDDKLYAITAATGQAAWTTPFGAPGQFRSSPAIGSDGTIYVGCVDHNVYAVNPDGSEKWAFATGGAVWSSPLIGPNGTIYVGSWDDHLYAIYGSSPALADSSWPMFRHDAQHGGALPTSANNNLSALGVSDGSLNPAFSASSLSYTDSVANDVDSVTVSPTVADSDASYLLQVDGNTVANPIALVVGRTTIVVVVSAQDSDHAPTP